MHFFNELESILTLKLPKEKCDAFRRFYGMYLRGELSMEPLGEPLTFDTPSYAAVCNIVSPKVVPKRTSAATHEGKIQLLHAIAHIEYSAIDLALDAVYRFRGLDEAYYADWLKVAADEVRHFEMLHGLLEELGSRYGALDVHNALFEVSRQTTTLLERMATVPRYLEASGLDATPQILGRLAHIKNDPFVRKMEAALNVILEEEVDHVLKGDRWFIYACEKAGCDKSVYFEIIEKFFPGSFPSKKSINAKGRMAAGFSCSELKRISPQTSC